MRYIRFFAALFVGITFTLAFAGAVQALARNEPTSASQGEDAVRLVQADERGVVLELSVSEIHVESQSEGGITCQTVHVSGFGETSRPGWPRLPVAGTLVGIPGDAKPQLTILETQAKTLEGRFNLCPVLSPEVEIPLQGPPQFLGWKAVQEAEVYRSDRYWPGELVDWEVAGWLRSQHVARVVFQPFQYNPLTGELKVYRHIRVRMDYYAGVRETAQEKIAPIDEGAFETLLQSSLVNYEQAREFRQSPKRRFVPQRIRDEVTPAYKIFVNQDGVYQVTHADLLAAGLPLGEIDPRTLHLKNQGQEVSIYVAGEDDGSFDAQDFLLFYGQRLNTKYTNTNVYWLTWGGAAGLRMVEWNGTPTGGGSVPAYFATTAHIEENRTYMSSRPSGANDDRWYWDFITASGAPASKSFSFSLHHLASSPSFITVRGLLRSYSAFPRHHTRIYLNDQLIDDAEWNPGLSYAFEVSVPRSNLLEGGNQIKVECVMDGGITQQIVLVNWFEVDYHDTYVAEGDALFFDGDGAGLWRYSLEGFSTADIEAFDITNPSTPIRIVGGLVEQVNGIFRLSFEHEIFSEHFYQALTTAQRLRPIKIVQDTASDLLSTTNSADYLIITHADFYDAMLPLAAWRNARGLRTMIVKVEDVYDEFNGGVYEAEAIRNFLAYAYHAWQPPQPAYVLLVGDGNFDTKNNTGDGGPDYIPPYLANVDPWLGETAADNRYVMIQGDDILPDMHIGRLAARTSAEAEAMVAKIIAYEQDPPNVGWNSRLLFVADNADGGGNFPYLSDRIAERIPLDYTIDRVYYGVTHTTPSAARTAIRNAINDGRLFVNYMGHASIQAWASESLLSVSAISSLNNAGKYPIMLPMTCLEGLFTWNTPGGMDYSALGEAIVRAAIKGAVASWSPAGLGVASGHDYIHRGFYEAVFTDGQSSLGAATTQAKLFLYSNTMGYRDLIDTYILFGDPALKINFLPVSIEIDKEVIPPGALYRGDAITYTIQYTHTGMARATHVVISDILPEGLTDSDFSFSGATITTRPDETYIWDVENLEPGQSGVITITARVDWGFSGILTNTVSIAYDGGKFAPVDKDDQVANLVYYMYYFPFIPVIRP